MTLDIVTPSLSLQAMWQQDLLHAAPDVRDFFSGTKPFAEWCAQTEHRHVSSESELSIPIKCGQQNHLTKLWSDILAVSMNCEDDEYDRLGRNVSAQQRRQELFPWFTVDRSRSLDNYEDEQ